VSAYAENIQSNIFNQGLGRLGIKQAVKDLLLIEITAMCVAAIGCPKNVVYIGCLWSKLRRPSQQKID
jgi:hypothetical protein